MVCVWVLEPMEESNAQIFGRNPLDPVQLVQLNSLRVDEYHHKSAPSQSVPSEVIQITQLREPSLL
ncbi:hypothetical protein Scep_006743 [Stephania cephalantha]|uniref:Uncharacterized protein n=1 Tax=Stephania cephalantha TaxID=152367 RepID=A0AAP0PPC2_9MAGN